MGALKLSGCMKLVSSMDESDQEALLGRLDQYQKAGIPAERAQVMAASDTLAELESERREFMAMLRDQHPDLFLIKPTAPKLSKQRDFTDTPAFKKWFGDSKVVDENGKPMVVYHGTVVREDTEKVKGMGDIQAFDRMFTTKFRAHSLDTVGSWFSTNPGDGGAEMYSGNGSGSAIYPVYLSIKNPQVTTFQLMTRRARLLANGKDDGRKIGQAEVDAYRKWLADTGKDGIKIEGSGNDGSTEFDNQVAWIALEPEQIKSATGNNGEFSPTNPDIRRSTQRNSLGFYSALAKGIEDMPTKQAPAGAWKASIKGLVNKGAAKQDEVTWSGIEDFLDLQDGKVTKEQVLDFLQNNGVQVNEVTLGSTGLSNVGQMYVDEANDYGDEFAVFDEEGRVIGGTYGTRAEAEEAMAEYENDLPAKYSQYTLPGGENYREVLLTLPTKEKGAELSARQVGDKWYLFRGNTQLDTPFSNERRALEALQDERDGYKQFKAESAFKSAHWDQENVLAHIRVNDRTDADGNKVLFVEEVQSDWGQEGKKKGFTESTKGWTAEKTNYGWTTRNPEGEVVDTEVRADSADAAIARSVKTSNPIPTAPFVTKTEGWLNLALKRIITMAVEGGYDKVAFVNGEQSADRYDLSKEVDFLGYNPEKGKLDAHDKNRHSVFSKTGVKPNEVQDYVGKEVAERLLASNQIMGTHIIEGAELKVGGEGMKTFYDSIVPNAVKALLKKVGGGQLQKVELPDSQRGRDLVAAELGDGAAWGVFDRNQGRWLVDQAGQETFVEGPEDADSYSEGAAKKMAAAIMRGAGSVLQQPGFDVTDAMREKVSAGLPLFSRQRNVEFHEDVPNESWLQSKIDYAAKSPRNQWGVPKMSSVTGYFNGPVMFPARWAPELKGERGEQDNVRQEDLAAIRKILRDTGKMPLTDDGKEYMPYIEIGYDGKPWISEGNHRIMAAVAEGWDYIPAEVRYFDGGQRRAGKWKPENLREITERQGDAMLSRQRTEDTPEFKRWSEGLPVVEQGEYEGGPAVFVAYHGTTHDDITEFKRVGASEGFLGKGPYFTTDPDDASANYAGIGPDLTSRIAREKEQIAESFESDNSVAWDLLQDYFDANGIETEITDENLDELKEYYEGDAIDHAATQALKGKSDGLMMKTYVKLTNPADASGHQMLDYNRIEDEDGEITDETGAAVDWVLKAREIGEQYGIERDMERHIDDVLEAAIDGDVSMKEVFDSAVKRLNEAYDDSGELLSGGAIFSEIAEELGYDGVIMDAGEHFGPARRGPMGIKTIGMKGVKNDTLHIVPFDGKQVKSFTGNNGQFDPTNPDIRKSNKRTTGDYGRQYTPQQLMMFENTGRTTSKPTLVERVKELRKDIGKKMAQGLVDQFRPLRDLGGQAYTLARLSKGAAGAFEALLQHGKLSITDGAYDADMSGGFIKQVGEPLGAELEDFMWWTAANRAERLKAEDRENLFTDDDIAAGKSLATGQMNRDYTLANGQVTRDRALAYEDSLKKFDAFNKNVLDIAEQSGLIDGDSRQYWEGEFYVPFYRVSDEDGEFVGAKIKGGLARQRAFHELKGGQQKLNSDLLANTMQNWAHLIDASAKNRAAKATLESSVNVGIAMESDEETVRQMGKSMGGKGGTVWFMDQGQKRHFLVGDPYVLEAINSLEYAGLRGPLMDALSKMKHVLTVGVTASPAFKVRNLIRDSLQAISLSGLSYNPLQNLRDGYMASDKNNQEYVSALASGGLIRFGTMAEGNPSEGVRRLVNKGVKAGTILDSQDKMRAFYGQYIEPAIEAYQEIGNRGEEINRAALYSQLRKQGVSHSEAALMARDMMDFNMQGTWAGIRFLTQVVPFMNARLQGLYKLGRAAQEDPRRMAMVTGAVALTSVALLAAYGDDDDWKKREDWDRDQFWWFKFGGTAFRIPKPFEIGAIASLAERGVELFTNDKFTGKMFADRVLHLLGDNLSMNPVPQAVKPIIDIYANKDAFSGRPIESMGMERLQSEYRYNSSTSMVARGVSSAMNATTRATIGTDALSPVQVDALFRSYFGWLGTFVIAGADMAIRPLTNEPTRPQADYLKVVTQGFLKSLPEDQSKYVSFMYEQAKVIDQAYATHRQLVKDGKVQEAQEFAAENKDLLARYRMIEAVKKSESDINRKVHEIEISDMDPAKKREEISRLRQKASDSAQRVY